MREIETERLILRQFRISDLTDFAAMMTDPEIVKYIGNGMEVLGYEGLNSGEIA